MPKCKTEDFFSFIDNCHSNAHFSSSLVYYCSAFIVIINNIINYNFHCCGVAQKNLRQISYSSLLANTIHEGASDIDPMPPSSYVPKRPVARLRYWYTLLAFSGDFANKTKTKHKTTISVHEPKRPKETERKVKSEQISFKKTDKYPTRQNITNKTFNVGKISHTIAIIQVVHKFIYKFTHSCPIRRSIILLFDVRFSNNLIFLFYRYYYFHV